MAKMPMEQADTFIDVTYKNTTAQTVEHDNYKVFDMSTTTDISGYSLVGLMMFDMGGTKLVPLYLNTSRVFVRNTHPSDNVNVAIGDIKVTYRYMKI